MKGCVMHIYTGAKDNCQAKFLKGEINLLNFIFRNSWHLMQKYESFNFRPKFLPACTARILSWMSCIVTDLAQLSLPVKESQGVKSSLGSPPSFNSFSPNLCAFERSNRGAYFPVFSPRILASRTGSPKILRNSWAAF